MTAPGATFTLFSISLSSIYSWYKSTGGYATDAVLWLATLLTIYLTFRLFVLDFYRVIVDKGAALVNYRAL